MPLYRYRARNKRGKSVSGDVDAVSETAAVRLLQSHDLVVTRVFLAGGELGSSARPHKRHQKLKQEDLLFFIRQVGVLLESGLPFLRALELTTDQTQSIPLYHVLRQMSLDVRAGLSFQSAILKYPKIFPPLWAYLIEAGETSGHLPFVLNQLADHIETGINMRKKIVSALVYPAVLIVAASGAILFFLVWVIPIFQNVFSQFHSKLPAITLGLVTLSGFIRRYLLPLGLLAAGLFYFLKRYFATPLGRQLFDRTVIRLPLFGPAVKDVIMARIAINLSTMLKSGINLVKSMEITSRAAGNAVFEGALRNACEEIQQGRTLSSAFAKNALFSPMMVSMIAVGEEGGSLPEMIEKVSKYYRARVDVFIERVGVLIEPLILVGMGVVIGTLFVAMFMPIIKLGSAIK